MTGRLQGIARLVTTTFSDDDLRTQTQLVNYLLAGGTQGIALLRNAIKGLAT